MKVLPSPVLEKERKERVLHVVFNSEGGRESTVFTGKSWSIIPLSSIFSLGIFSEILFPPSCSVSCALVISLPSHCTSTGDCLHFWAFKFTSSIPDKSVLLPEAVCCCCSGSGGPALVGETFSSSAVTVPTDHGSDNELGFAISLLNTLARGKKPNQPNPNNSQVKRFPRSQRNSNKQFSKTLIPALVLLSYRNRGL